MKKLILILLICFETIPFLGFAQKVNVEWQTVDGVNLPIPPKEHPRLYLRKQHIPDLKSRMNNPDLKEVWDTILEMRRERSPSEIPTEKGWRYYVDQRGITVQAEVDALMYLLEKNSETGRKAIETIIDTIEVVEWPHMSDISRAVGRMMVTGAIVYDWCYDLLTEKEKKRFVKAFVRLAKMMESGYPPNRQNAITGHSSEWMIMRDMLSAGIAIYDEYPEMYNLVAGRFFKELLPARNWFYPGRNYHQGTDYINVRMSSDLFALWILDRMGAGNVFHPSQQFILYDLIYRRRPDGQVLPAGDVNYNRKSEKTYSLPMMLAASYYKDEFLNFEFKKKTEIDSRSILFDFLWRDVDLGEKEPDSLPLTKYSGSPFGWMLARTGWDENSVIAEMKINEYNFLNHQHHDAGSFQIYYKGPLAIDSGSYKGSSGGYNSPHNKNYFKRTIAHNSLLIYDPEEEFLSWGYGGSGKTKHAVNDGGQRLPGNEWSAPWNLDSLLNKDYKTGEVLAHQFGPDYDKPDYSYLKGDITQAYSDKVSEVKRSFVFLNLENKSVPAALVVFDRIKSKKASYTKHWLLHSIEEPELTKDGRICIKRTKNGDSGIMFNTVLLPRRDNLDLTTIGGEGMEFWVFGANYKNDAVPGTDAANERGSWRVELSPRKPSEEDSFLNVMQVMDDESDYLSVGRIESDEMIGISIADRMVFFGKGSEKVEKSFVIDIPVDDKNPDNTYKILLTDIDTGDWQIKRDGQMIYPALPVKDSEGTLYFEGPSGQYTFSR